VDLKTPTAEIVNEYIGKKAEFFIDKIREYVNKLSKKNKWRKK